MTIYRPNSVDIEPSTKLSPWELIEVKDLKSGGVLYHYLCGYCGEGRTSSPVKHYNPHYAVVTTESGRQYSLSYYGQNRDARYVKNIKEAYNKEFETHTTLNEHEALEILNKVYANDHT